MADHEVYAQQMFSMRRGLGLLEPNPAVHQFDRVRVGDVGYVEFGSLYRLFNVFYDSDHEINSYGVPDDFEPLPLNRQEVSTREPLMPGVRKSTGVRRVGVEACATGVAMEPGAKVKLVCESRQGAALITKNFIKCEDAVRMKAMKDYIGKNCDSWHKFAISEGRDIQLHDLILVTGCDLTTDWAMATFNERSSGVEVSFEVGGPVASAGFSIWGEWSSTVDIPYRCGPILTNSALKSPLTEQFNQCVFIRGFRKARRLPWFKKLYAAAEPKDFDGEPSSSDFSLTREIENLGEPRSDTFADIYNIFWHHVFHTTDVDEMVVHDNDIIALIPEDSDNIITDLAQALAEQTDLGTTEQPSLSANFKEFLADTELSSRPAGLRLYVRSTEQINHISGRSSNKTRTGSLSGPRSGKWEGFAEYPMSILPLHDESSHPTNSVTCRGVPDTAREEAS
ncbi:hypothetical protein DFH11DRAFT_854157 [Phellopilus nigrolimitatus]|nr:hypothetical protein DFH11DRAFT_854157 [Phellopilus nigrolimitatus]